MHLSKSSDKLFNAINDKAKAESQVLAIKTLLKFFSKGELKKDKFFFFMNRVLEADSYDELTCIIDDLQHHLIGTC